MTLGGMPHKQDNWESSPTNGGTPGADSESATINQYNE